MSSVSKCPFCETRYVAYQLADKQRTATYEDYHQLPDGSTHPGDYHDHFYVVNCPECGNHQVVHHRGYRWEGMSDEVEVIWPQKTATVPDEVPEEYAADYREAVDVLPFSPKSTAVLCRRVLEHLLNNEFELSEDGFFDQIGELLKSDNHGLPAELVDNLDMIRNIGNFGAHRQEENKSGQLLDVDHREAEFVVQVLKDLLEQVFVLPERRRKARKQFDEKLAAEGNKELRTTATASEFED